MKILFEKQKTLVSVTEENKLSIDVLGIVCEYDLKDARDLNKTILASIEIMIENERKQKPIWKRIF